MPELPEVETITRQLQEVLPGKVIREIEVRREKSFKGEIGRLEVRKIVSVKRKQKIIVIELTDSMVMLIHLKMTGQIILVPSDLSLVPSDIKLRTKDQGLGMRMVGGSSTTALARLRLAGGHPTKDWVGELPSKHTRVMIHFTDNSVLYFNDQRVFGWMKIVSRVKWKVLSQSMPPDVIDPEFTIEYLQQVLKKTARAIKLVILDQDMMGGMGNIYANDALYLARIYPLQKANTLTQSKVIKLHQAMITVLNKGIETGGASYSHFVDTEGMGGHYQDHFLVYDKEGKACPTCGSKIQKIQIGGRGTYFCPKCQGKR